MKIRLIIASALWLFAVTAFIAPQMVAAQDIPRGWKTEWKKTDFTKRSVDLSEIFSGGPPKDGIPSIDRPTFEAIKEADWLTDRSPVISLEVAGEARAYPLAILTRHEIVNDRMGDMPIAVTFCPLCNAAIVFERQYNGRELEFGTTGKLRNSDLVMYDRQTESWWQQFTGTAIVGRLTGAELERLPSRLESFARFKERFPHGKVLKRPYSRTGLYGANPYEGYDSLARPFLYDGSLPKEIPAMARVVSVGERAWTLDLLRRETRIETVDGLILEWVPGQASALDAHEIDRSRDVGNVSVQRKTADGLVDVVHGVDFAFAFHAFYPDARIIHDIEAP
ncbi:hypothetical protein JCM17844_09560 [Iodidimonas gelatinilytica]|uniref:DUF3179 domain-containing protein n=1 Tax=Iodidimonas gelatinilytica TaxID=1236966 RepID=A0A5A7MR26_9PROT|nr:DUF3179 domain-containing protein [Iodidimonas gelatinilytica]GEQ97319.1 hypothetical protein JCM17844_09560 [Iodidimonas gelatinilytica]